MKKSLLLLSFAWFAPALSAAAPHPSVLKVKFNNQMLPVVRVQHDDPYVMVDSKETLIRADPVYSLDRADGYSSNFVEAPRGGLGGKFRMELIGANTYDVSALHQGEIRPGPGAESLENPEGWLCGRRDIFRRESAGGHRAGVARVAGGTNCKM